MELKDFIKTTLLEITDAVLEAREKSTASIAPFRLHGRNGTEIEVITSNQLIEFDLAITETNKGSSNKEGNKIGIKVLSSEVSLEGKVGKNSETVQQTANRIKFSVPVYFQFTSKKP